MFVLRVAAVATQTLHREEHPIQFGIGAWRIRANDRDWNRSAAFFTHEYQNVDIFHAEIKSSIVQMWFVKFASIAGVTLSVW